MTAPHSPDSLGREAYALICSRDGVTARDIARELGVERKDVNRLLYGDPFVRDLCYRDTDYRWHGLIRHGFPHEGLSGYCGRYGTAQAEVDQAAKYAPYLQVVLGPQAEVVPALVLTRVSDLFDHVRSTGGAQVAVASPDMLFNVFDERLGFLG